MFSRIFLFVGFILLGVGAIVYFSMANSNSILLNNVPTKIDSLSLIAQILIKYGIAGFLGGLALFFIVIGLKGSAKMTATAKLNAQILQSGVSTEATVTFVDKNWQLLVNHKPIYSIIEYSYVDNFGNQHTNKLSNVNSDSVIRAKIEVGSRINIKYLSTDPKQSAMQLFLS